jgi:general secretion pathway protein C
MSINDRVQKLFSGLKGKKRPPLEKFYVLFLAIFIGYLIADTGVLYTRQYLLPTEAPVQRNAPPIAKSSKQIQDYRNIINRNIFNEDGLIADALSAGDNKSANPDGEPVETQLPIKLQGTIVHFNPKLSLATVEISSKSMSSSYRIDEEIEGMAKVMKIERKKVIFRNLNNGRPEFSEIKDDDAFNLGLQAGATSDANDIVQKRGANDFAIKRSDVENLTSNLSQVLQQARMEPVYSSDGVSVEGFRFVRIQPGTIYEKLGFKAGDMIRSVNGEPVNSPQKAMEMYNLLKNSNYVQMGIERDGREEKFNYSIQ